MHSFSLFSILFLSVTAAQAAGLPLAARRVTFEENRGQAGEAVRYLARLRGQHVYLSSREVVFAPWDGAPLRFRFLGANPKARWEPVGPAQEVISYRVGNDPRRWVDQAPMYERVAWRGVYPGIDAVFYTVDGVLEYDLVVAPGADPSQIRIEWRDAAEVESGQDGSLLVRAEGTLIRQRAPHVYQDSAGRGRRAVEARYVAVAQREFRLELGAFDGTRPLVIDPVLELASYVGGENEDEIIATGPVFVAGHTRSIAIFPVPRSERRGRDIFLRGVGTTIVSGTAVPVTGTVVFGGSDDDQLTAAVQYQSGSATTVLLAGATKSRDLAADGSQSATTTYGGGASDGFVASAQLLVNRGFAQFGPIPGMRYVGGSGEDRLTSISAVNSGMFVTGVTDSPDLPGTGGGSSLGGGRDGFLALLGFTGGPQATLYLGGEGDDEALASAAGGFVAGSTGLNQVFWFAGETRSRNFPYRDGGSQELQGASDAFLGQVAVVNDFVMRTYRLEGVSTRLLGGSGEDRIRAISSVADPVPATSIPLLRPSDVAPVVLPTVVGSTTSPDLPLVNASQSTFGGERDMFVGVWDRAGGRFAWLTYVGGSGAEEATSVTQNWAGDIFVGGWTASTDVPLTDPLQGTPGGGRDGLFALFDRFGRPLQVTYYGGNGDDSVNGVVVTGDNLARVAGTTQSDNLPEVRALQSKPARSVDGFVAEIGTAYISGPTEIILGKDSARTISLRGGYHGYLPLTYRSTDPSRVKFYYLGRVVESLTALAEENVTIEAYADSGEVAIEVTAEGHLPKTIRVKLYPSVIAPTMQSRRLSTWTTLNLSSGVGVYPVDPVTGVRLGTWFSVRSGMPPFVATYSSSDPGVVEVVSEYNPSFGSVQWVARPVAPGEARLIVQAPGYALDDSVPIILTVERPRLVVGPMTLARDLQRGLPISFLFDGQPVSSGVRGMFKARSEDPSRLLLSADFGSIGQAEVTVAAQNQRISPIYAQALAGEGTVRVIITSTEFEGESVLEVNLEPTVLRWGLRLPGGATSSANQAASGVRLTMRQPAQVLLSLGGLEESSLSPRPGAPPFTVRLSSSDPTVVELSHLTLRAPQNDSGSNAPEIRARGVGTSVISLMAQPGVRVEGGPIQVTTVAAVESITTSVKSISVGNRLQKALTVRRTFRTAIQAISSDPSRLLLSRTSTGPASGELLLEDAAGSEVAIYLQGMADSGDTVLRLRATGGVEQEVQVRHLPSGIVLTRADPNIRLSAYTLDRETLIPLESLLIGAGQSVEGTLRVEGAAVELGSTSYTLTPERSNASISFVAPGQGESAVVIADPPAQFTKPSIEGRVELTPAGPIGLTTTPAALALQEGLVGSYAFTIAGFRAGVPLLARSSDGSKMRLSTRADEAGAAEITWTPQNPNTSLFLHGMSSSGRVMLEILAEGRPPLRIPVILMPLRLGISGRNPLRPGQAETFQLSHQFSLPMQGTNIAGARPGAAPLAFSVRSSNPAIVRVTGGQLQFGGAASRLTFQVEGVSDGEATLVFEGPETVYLPAPFRIFVAQQQLGGQDAEPVYYLGKNMQGLLELALPEATAGGAIATITSSDPGRLLVSRSNAATGSGSLTVAVPPSTGTLPPVYIQALAGEGEVAVAVSIPGARTRTVVVHLVPTWLTASPDFGSIPRVNVGTTRAIYFQWRFDPPPVAPSGPAGSVPRSPRDTRPVPGLGTIRAKVQARPAGLATIYPDEVTVNADGQFSNVTLRAMAAGFVTLVVEQPPGFGPAMEPGGGLSVELVTPTVVFGCQTVLGLHMQVSCDATAAVPGTPITVVSSDPSRLLVSPRADVAGAAGLTTSGNAMVTLQSLASAGTVEVILSGPDHAETRVPVRLRPSQIAFGASANITFAVNRTYAVSLQLQYESEFGAQSGTPRAGLSIPLTITSTPGGIVAVEPANPVLGRGSELSLRGLAPGTTVLRLTPPPGFVEAERGTIAVRVTPQ